MSHGPVDRLVLLVGSNPLPNYLAAQMLQPKQVVLVYSAETELVMRALGKAFDGSLPALGAEGAVTERRVRRTTVTADVREACADVFPGAHLHCTGGAKIMAAHARMAFRDQGGMDDSASYLDEQGRALRYDDGFVRELTATVPL